MKKIFPLILMVFLSFSAAACTARVVARPAAPRLCCRTAWVPGHYTIYGRWVPGHWR